jgi:uncharacterized protein (DUF302 family)
MTYTTAVTTGLSVDEALAGVRAALAGEGFGVLTEIDIASTFLSKLGPESAARVGEYVILGACNPVLAERALGADPSVGALLPCNVVVRRAPGATLTTVEAIDPQTMVQLSSAPEMEAVADDASKRLSAALSVLSSS